MRTDSSYPAYGRVSLSSMTTLSCLFLKSPKICNIFLHNRAYYLSVLCLCWYQVTYGTSVVNAGGDFNTATGYFTCRVPGYYYFTFHSMAKVTLCRLLHFLLWPENRSLFYYKQPRLCTDLNKNQPADFNVIKQHYNCVVCFSGQCVSAYSQWHHVRTAGFLWSQQKLWSGQFHFWEERDIRRGNLCLFIHSNFKTLF